MMHPRLSMDEFCDVVRKAIDELPENLRPLLENLVVDVEVNADRDLLRKLGHNDHGESLLGVFLGTGLDEQSFGERTPNRIIIFKHPIEAICRCKAEIAYEVRRTVLHELAHHFGYSEEDLDFFEERPTPFDDPPPRR